MHNALKWLLAVMLSLPLVAFAETAYITEKLEIPVRSGESRDYRIIRYLQAGAQVEILETYESGYTKIKDERGREGFVLGRYLVDRAPSFVIAGRLEAEVAKQKETIKRLQQDIKALTSQNESSGESVKAIKEQLAKKEAELNEFLATAGDSITLRNRLVALETERQVLLADNETLRAEKLAAGDDSSKSWFALGALTLAAGWFVGLLMPRVRRSRVDTNL
ncbi:MAG: TIGR04211 family SH3 domain-containing protein [Gammaproteobacteria bacterium]|jgi:SH3 domain protein|nr:TIGR04211 family SH3 domain-containing protein [Gammaproteobacteria bacterium]NCW08548.1 TIGR04211 family SH3 domain-containing protein [Gammaproteobacteria bacterium]NCW73095.1 TIGR04211 family SH3 domain-containing protein [Gammaproteobacteria bacterium]NCX48197.1 TIGR04211 family SH3 domain-containing protein [Gammaproteobacteria bacterium]